MLEASSVPGIKTQRPVSGIIVTLWHIVGKNWFPLNTPPLYAHTHIPTIERKPFLLPFFSADQYQSINSGEHTAAEKGITRDTFSPPALHAG